MEGCLMFRVVIELDMDVADAMEAQITGELIAERAKTLTPVVKATRLNAIKPANDHKRCEAVGICFCRS
jgi:hypothetical protein